MRFTILGHIFVFLRLQNDVHAPSKWVKIKKKTKKARQKFGTIRNNDYLCRRKTGESDVIATPAQDCMSINNLKNQQE